MTHKKIPVSMDEILSACADNDRYAQEQLYRHFFGTMVGMCRKYMHNDEDIQSVVNDGFLKGRL